MTAISEHGLPKLTLAKIADIAGLSAGSVNFHFDSKEALLLATLTELASEFEGTILQAIDRAGSNPAQKLLAMFEASLDPQITEPRKTAVWFAFTSEARSRADYQRICGAQDQKIFAITRQLCDEIIHQGDRQGQMNAHAMANAVQGLIDEIWQDILYAGADYNRADARSLYLSFLASVFPWAFDMPGNPEQTVSRLSPADKTLRIVRAGKEQLAALASLFDAYRQFYQREPDLALARRFLGQNLAKQRSVIYLAVDPGDTALGFAQLYPGWCSVATTPIWILYDLFVTSSVRQRGVGQALLQEAEKMARKSGASRIDLETAVDNYQAQSLYESLGYARETEFYKYSLVLA
ncbi:MAG: GNAT family N-acetyltransferase [Pseudomonadales bacterium]|nr:GNAT family N-acetyltransferase [Pseudomonadales bacterium]MCP5192532.1 GNAT family N-acetyltransferase [Pseudomonadales bacterium]